ncbi:MAG: hypothetical protein Pars92KO_27420 [Parasphingorhabdus sp.]
MVRGFKTGGTNQHGFADRCAQVKTIAQAIGHREIDQHIALRKQCGKIVILIYAAGVTKLFLLANGIHKGMAHPALTADNPD